MKLKCTIPCSIFILVSKFSSGASFDGEKVSIIEDPTCPCLGNVTHTNSIKSFNDTCLDIQIESMSTKVLSSYCYPPNYGTSCEAHDMNLAPFCSDPNDQAPFCNAPFCYIDPAKCKLSENNSYSQSSIFPHLFFSYTTCGSNDDWKSLIAKNINGVTLRVGVPTLRYPDHFRLDTNGDPILFDMDINAGVGELKGIYIEMLEKLALHANFTVQYESVSAYARKVHGSGWDACVEDVGRGILDMCVGNFWETTKRREMVQFTTTVFSDVFYMRVPHPKRDESFQAELQKLFQPFTSTLWFTIIIATICVGLTYTLLDSNRKTAPSDFPGKIMASIYTATMELMNGANQSEDQPMCHKSVTVTWSFFVLIVIASYTANLAAFLSQKKAMHNIVSVEDCIKKNCSFCHHTSSSIRTVITNKYPSFKRFHEIDMDSLHEVPIALSNGICDIYVESRHTWDFNEQLWGKCETMWLGDVSFAFKVGWPVSATLSESVTFWLGVGLENGVLDTSLHKYKPLYRCDEGVDRNDVDDSTEQIGVKSMTGPLLLLGAGIAFGIFYKGLKDFKDLKSPLKHLEILSEGSVAVESPNSMAVVEVTRDGDKERVFYY